MPPPLPYMPYGGGVGAQHPYNAPHLYHYPNFYGQAPNSLPPQQQQQGPYSYGAGPIHGGT